MLIVVRKLKIEVVKMNVVEWFFSIVKRESYWLVFIGVIGFLLGWLVLAPILSNWDKNECTIGLNIRSVIGSVTQDEE